MTSSISNRSDESYRVQQNCQSVATRRNFCVYCRRSFKRAEHLQRHIRTHTKDKPYICHCGTAFARRDLLTRHERLAHKHDRSCQNERAHNQSSEAEHVNISSPSLAEAASEAGLSVPRWIEPTSGQGTESQWPSQAQGEAIFPRNRSDAVDTVSQSLGPIHNVAFNEKAIEQHSQLIPQNNGDTGDYLGAEASFGFLNDSTNHFQEFASFLSSVGLPAEWTPPDLGHEFEVSEAHEGSYDKGDLNHNRISSNESCPSSPFGSWPPSVPQGDQPLSTISDKDPRDSSFRPLSLQVSSDMRAQLNADLEKYQDILSNFTLPSRHTLNRYIISFFGGFHSHLQFLHVPTFRLANHPIELILAICATGAQYCFEHRNSQSLFCAAKAILLSKLGRGEPAPNRRAGLFLPFLNLRYQSFEQPSCSTPGAEFSSRLDHVETVHPKVYEKMETIRCLLILMGYATWEGSELLNEALGLQHILVHCLREIGLRETLENDSIDAHQSWIDWAEQESVRRTKLVCFTFIHVHSIAYNVYPALRSNEIHLRLPCSTREWNAPTMAQWRAVRRDVKKQQLYFQNALSLLLTTMDGNADIDPVPAPLGNYILLHGLLQRMHIVRELSLSTLDNSTILPEEELEKIERALRSWTSIWKQAPESSLDPSNENGPIPFTSSSLLGLAYIRACLNLGPHRALETRDPSRIATAITMAPSPTRGRFLIPALIFSTHALSIPVRLGIDSVARSQAFFWSVRHSLSSLECAVFLSKWLCSLSQSHSSHLLTENENRILHWVSAIIQEALSYLDADTEDNGMAINATQPYTLGLAVLRLWARLFKQNVQWPFINIIGEGLEKYAEMLQEVS